MSNENDGGWGSFDWMSGSESVGGSAPAFGWQGGLGGGWDDRQSRMDALFGGSDWNTDFFDFLDPVGPDQPNRREDVIKLESLLGNSGHYDVSRTDGPTGWWGTPLEDGLKDYQKEKGLEVDGLVLPKGPTLASLKGDLAPKMGGFRAPSAAEVDRHHTNNRRGEGGLLVDRAPPLKFHPAPNLPELGDDVFAANRRSAPNLARLADPGDFPNLAKLAVGDYGDQAIAELRDLVGRIGEINPMIADTYGRAIKNALEPEQRAAFLGGPERPDPPLGVLKAEAEARLGSFPSLDDARQALAEQIGRGGEDADGPVTIREENGVVTATSQDGALVAMHDTQKDATDQSAPHDLDRFQTDAGAKGGQTHPLPDWKNLGRPDTVSEKDWDAFKEALGKNSALTDHERHAFLLTFGHEGGQAYDPNGGGKDKPAVAGLTKGTLEGLNENLDRKKPNDPGGRLPTDPEKLTVEQQVTAYKRLADELMRTDKSSERLDDLKDAKASAQLFDIFIQNAPETRGKIVQNAVNEVYAKLPEEVRKQVGSEKLLTDGDLGQKTRGYVSKMIELGYGEDLRDAIAWGREVHWMERAAKEGLKPDHYLKGSNRSRIDVTR